MLQITAMLKDGGYAPLKITAPFLADLAKAIQKKGSEVVWLSSGSLEVVGFLCVGKQVGDRVIVLGNPEKE